MLTSANRATDHLPAPKMEIPAKSDYFYWKPIAADGAYLR